MIQWMPRAFCIGFKSFCRSFQATGMAIVVLLAALAAARAEDIPIRVTLNREIDGSAAPFLAARRAKFFKRERLDVSIVAGNGSHESIQRVASGDYQFGVADISQFVRYLAENPDARVTVSMMLKDNTIRVTVMDQGEGFNAFLPDPDIERIVNEQEPAVGFGTFLIRQLADQVEIDKTADGASIVRMTIKL